jgi:hypothetical protein
MSCKTNPAMRQAVPRQPCSILVGEDTLGVTEPLGAEASRPGDRDAVAPPFRRVSEYLRIQLPESGHGPADAAD